MTLTTRLVRLLRADMHALLDRLEQPELLLQQAIREMQDAVARSRRQARLASLARAQLASHQEQLQESLAETTARLEDCLRSPDQGRARKLLRRKLEALRLQKVLARRQADLTASCETALQQLDDQQARLQSIQQQAALLVACKLPGNPDRDGSCFPDQLSAEEVEAAFRLERQLRGAS